MKGNQMNIPNCWLYTSTDLHGNEIQSLVPFGEDEVIVFAREHPDWSGDKPEIKARIFGATIRAFLAS